MVRVKPTARKFNLVKLRRKREKHRNKYSKNSQQRIKDKMTEVIDKKDPAIISLRTQKDGQKRRAETLIVAKPNKKGKMTGKSYTETSFLRKTLEKILAQFDKVEFNEDSWQRAINMVKITYDIYDTMDTIINKL